MRILAIAIGVLLLSTTAVGQAQPPIAVEVRPSEIALAPWDKSAEAVVVLLNKGTTPIASAKLLTAFTNDAIVATVRQPDAPRLEPNDSYAWRVAVDLSEARIPGSVDFELRYTLAGEKRHRTSYHTLKFKAADGAIVESPMDVSFKGSLESVSEQRPGRGYIVAVNKLDVPVKVTSIRVRTSDAESFNKEGPFFDDEADRTKPAPDFVPFEVAPRSSHSQFIELRASSSPQSGKHGIVFVIDTAWKRHGRDHSRTYVLPHDVTLGVFFESDLLKLLSVPSFLLLPGWLFLATISVLLRFNWGGANKPAQWPKLEPPSAEFWVVAVSLSGVFAIIYAWSTETDLLIRYGAADLRFVWLSSIGAGAVFYALMVLWNRQRSRNRPGIRDSAMTTLAKMGARGLGLRVQKADVTLKNAPLTAFVVDDSDTQAVWVAPPIELKWKGDQSTLPEKQKIIELIDNGTAAALVAALKANAASVTADFNFSGSVQALTALTAADVKPAGEEPMVTVN